MRVNRTRIRPRTDLRGRWGNRALRVLKVKLKEEIAVVTSVHRIAGLAIVTAIWLAGCSSVNRYVPPTSQDVATITGKWLRNSWFDWESYSVTTVDDLYVKMPAFNGEHAARVALTPEPHRIVAYSKFNRQFGGGGPFDAYVALAFEPKANGRYRVNGRVRDNLFEIWVEDLDTGERASEVVEVRYRQMPTGTTYIPIYIPAGR